MKGVYQFNLLVYGQDSIKNTVGRSAKKNYFYFSILRVGILERKFIFSVNKEEKPVIVSVQSVYSLCLFPFVKNSTKFKSRGIIIALLYINLGFSGCCLNILQVKDEIWNETLNDANVYICLITLFFLFANKCKNMKRINEKWSYTLHQYYCLYEFLYSRLESK